MNTRAGLDYRRSTAEGASSIGLTIALYDTLAGDLHKVAAAVQGGDIESRCKHTHHALLVLGHLESWIDPAANDALSHSLREFYSYIRSRIMLAQTSGTGAPVAETAKLILETRAAWQQHEERLALKQASFGEEAMGVRFAGAPSENLSELGGRWSA